MDKIRGVNLGNWLVLEKWMHPALFEGTSAEDEDELCRQLPREELVKRLTAHRDSYITKMRIFLISAAAWAEYSAYPGASFYIRG